MRKSKQQELKEYIEEMKTIRKIILDEEASFLQLERYCCEISNNRKVYREKLIKNKTNGSAVIVLPITTDNDVILTVQPRPFTKTTVGVGLPAGYVEEDESYEDAAIRELEEETGYTSKRFIECCGYYQDDGCSEAFNKGYIALGCEKNGVQHLDKDEFIRYFKCHFEELLEMLNQGMILDGGSQLVIEKAKKYIKR